MKKLTHNDLMEPLPKGATLFFRIWRGLRGFWHAMLPATMSRSFIRGGIRYETDLTDYVAKGIAARGYLERKQVLHFFNKARVRECDIFLDIGYNFGFYSLTASKTGDFAEIHAMEAHPKTYRRLVGNIKANNLQSVITPHNIAASDKKCELFIDDKSSGAAAVGDKREGASTVVQAAPLDSLFDFVGRNIAMKMDVEGHEVFALEGMKNLLAQNSVLLQVEVLPRNSEKSVDYLLNAGLRCVYFVMGDFYFVNDKALASALVLSDKTPFAEGGHKSVYLHPHNPSRCLKVMKPDAIVEEKGQTDPLEEEWRGARAVAAFGNLKISQHMPAYYGFVPTDIGRGLCVEIIRDVDGGISPNLEEVILSGKYGDDVVSAIDEFLDCAQHRFFSYDDFGLNNLLVKTLADGCKRIYYSEYAHERDGMNFFLFFRMMRKRKRIRKMRKNIGLLLARTKEKIDNE